MPFLTLEDPRAKIKGSRDPLGVLPIWTHIGRKLVTNLTVAANSVRGFSLVLLGRYFGERLIESSVIHESEALPVFLRMEQIGAYVRCVGSGVEDDIRGIDRVRVRLRENRSHALIEDSPSGRILSDQRVYGLWGLFSVSARASGLLQDGPVGLTPLAREFVEETYLPILQPSLKELERLLVRGGRLQLNTRNQLFKNLLSALPDPIRLDEAEFHARTLRDATETPHILPTAVPGRQRRLRQLLERHTDLEAPVDRAEMEALERAAAAEDEGLAIALRQAQILEGLIVLAVPCFEHLLLCHGQSPRDAAAAIEKHWGRALPNLDTEALHGLHPELVDAAREEITQCLLRTAAALAAADYEEACHALLEWNAQVMKQRSTAPWVRLQSGKIDVRYRGAESRLPEGDDLLELWFNSYFVNSLKRITHQLSQAR